MPLQLYKRDNSPYWYIRGKFGGREIRESTGCTDKREADRVRHEFEKQILAESLNAGRTRVSEAVRDYVDAGGEERFVGRILDVMGDYFLDECDQVLADQKAVEAYPGISNASLLRQFYTPLNSIMRLAVKRGKLKGWSIDKPKAKRPVHKWAEPEWFEAFWPYCSPAVKLLTTILPYTGVRISEAMAMTWDKIRIEDATVFIPETKNGFPRLAHLPPVVIEELLKYRPENATGRVFACWKHKTTAIMAIGATIDKANADRAGKGLPPLERLTSHQLGSHTFATWMRRYAGMDTFGLMATGRWKDQKSVAIYTHARPSEESIKANRLPVPGKTSETPN